MQEPRVKSLEGRLSVPRHKSSIIFRSIDANGRAFDETDLNHSARFEGARVAQA